VEPKKSVRDVSVVICTKDAVELLKKCLIALEGIDFHEVIVVDAKSSDGTADVAVGFGCKVLRDLGVGLGAARNVGLKAATGEFILNLGPDNTTSQKEVEMALQLLVSSSHSGVSFTTKVLGEAYLARAMNFWREQRFPSGPATVIGTPSLFFADVLKANPYDSTRNYSDDGELCDRLADLGHTFAISEAECLEHGKTSLGDIVRTWRLYGGSDFEHYRQHLATGADWRKRYRSVTHPLRVELIAPIRRSPAKSITFIPVLALLVIARYSGWISKTLRHNKI
jgi:glycosyltransferase involved in cell wall biosynthesis